MGLNPNCRETNMIQPVSAAKAVPQGGITYSVDFFVGEGLKATLVDPTFTATLKDAVEAAGFRHEDELLNGHRFTFIVREGEVVFNANHAGGFIALTVDLERVSDRKMISALVAEIKHRFRVTSMSDGYALARGDLHRQACQDGGTPYFCITRAEPARVAVAA